MNREVVLNYLEVLYHATKKKEKIINELLKISKSQQNLISSHVFDISIFIQYVDQKEEYLKELTIIDEGFAQTFERIKDMIMLEKTAYQAQIEQLQQCITEITSKAIELQAIEKQNKLWVDNQIAEGKEKIKAVNISSKVANSYYKNMPNTHYQESYFLDKKK